LVSPRFLYLYDESGQLALNAFDDFELASAFIVLSLGVS
jgi:hypothetical protein